MPPSFDSPRCRHCGDVIGVYEPIVVREGGEFRETARAAEPGLPLVHGEHYHRACHAALEQGAGGP